MLNHNNNEQQHKQQQNITQFSKARNFISEKQQQYLFFALFFRNWK